MSDVIANMTGPQLIGFVAVTGGLLFVTVTCVVGIVMPYLHAGRRLEAATKLKRDLVAAGYSADDIERIVRVGTDADELSRTCDAVRR
jgi:hypothetical protein